MAEEKAAKSASTASRAKKEKPPKPEDKPFTEFMEQHFVPTLADALGKAGIEGAQLTFAKSQLAVQGASAAEDYWQVRGQWANGGDRRFSVVFTEEDIKSPKFFYYSQGDNRASMIEQFMGDERRITLDLMVLYTLQRLNGQKWLERN
ncbi:MAG: DUF2996 domain-containing protein [Cyanobacteria bacterium P01_H01_bin.58]